MTAEPPLRDGLFLQPYSLAALQLLTQTRHRILCAFINIAYIQPCFVTHHSVLVSFSVAQDGIQLENCSKHVCFLLEMHGNLQWLALSHLNLVLDKKQN